MADGIGCDLYRRLIKNGCTVSFSPSPEARAVRVRVTHPDHGGVTRFISCEQLDLAVDAGNELLHLTLVEIDWTLHRHQSSEVNPQPPTPKGE